MQSNVAKCADALIMSARIVRPAPSFVRLFSTNQQEGRPSARMCKRSPRLVSTGVGYEFRHRRPLASAVDKLRSR